MNDRELLEMAAKAVGLPECGWMGPAFMYVKDNTFTDWDPLTDDGDALRLAVALKLKVTIAWDNPTLVEVEWIEVFPDGTRCVRELESEQSVDVGSETRRAIVRAAAKIAKAAGGAE